MAAIDEHCELNARRPAKGRNGVHRRAAGAAGEEDVVGEDERFAFQIVGQMRLLHRPDAAARVDIVAVHGDIDHALGDLVARDLRDVRHQPARDLFAAGRDADDGEGAGLWIGLDDLVRDALEGPLNGGGIEDERGLGGRRDGWTWLGHVAP